MEDKQLITIHIADTAPLKLNIERDKEEMARKVASQINEIWAKWSKDFPDKTSKDVLAMIAYQYAKTYCELLDQVDANQAALEDAEAALDSILLDVK